MVRSIALFLLLAPSLLADTKVLAPYRDTTRAAATIATQPPLRAQGRAPVIVTTAGASREDIAELRVANATGDGPAQIGIVREVQPTAIVASMSDGGRFQWRGSVQVEGATRVRVRLDDVNLPAGARLWIYGTNGEAIAFDASLAHERQLWTPSIAGNVATVEVDAPSQAAFRIGAVADIRAYGEVAPDDSSCVSDISCNNSGDGLDRAISFYHYAGGTRIFGCTGGLVNNIKRDGTPYFLTANHCVRNAAGAASVEAYWDFRTSSCNGAAPSLDSLQKTNGATLIVTSPATDVTLLKLNAVPPNRTFLGYDARELADGTQLFHISHPLGVSQRYSTSSLITSGSTCTSSPRPSFIYSTPNVGATDVGSSGAPVMYGDGFIVGQLKGGCGPEPENPCNRENREVDGAFAASFAALQPFLDPAPECAACVPGTTTACLLGNRFKVTMKFDDPNVHVKGDGKPIFFAENKPQIHPEHGPLLEQAFFTFFDFFPGSVEMTVKMTKGVGINNKFWIYVGGFTSSHVVLTVQDTKTCAIWERTIPGDSQTILRDYEAFPFP